MTWSQSTSRFDAPPEGDPAAVTRRWDARLSLVFRRDPRRTTLAERRHVGPLGVQQPFYPEGDGTCHVYLLHPPGGIASGDALVIDARLLPQAQALITTPAATKLYRSDRNTVGSEQAQHFSVAAGACLEWLPQETIVFDGAHSQLTTRVELAEGAHFVGWELLCLGRPAAGEAFQRGRLRQAFEIHREGRPLFIERGLYAGGARVLREPWGLSGQPIVGTMVCASAGTEALVADLRAALAPDALSALATGAGAHLGRFSVSQLRDVLVCRYVGPRTEAALVGFRRAWGIVRTAVYGRRPSEPRIWLT